MVVDNLFNITVVASVAQHFDAISGTGVVLGRMATKVATRAGRKLAEEARRSENCLMVDASVSTVALQSTVRTRPYSACVAADSAGKMGPLSSRRFCPALRCLATLNATLTMRLHQALLPPTTVSCCCRCADNAPGGEGQTSSAPMVLGSGDQAPKPSRLIGLPITNKPLFPTSAYPCIFSNRDVLSAVVKSKEVSL